MTAVADRVTRVLAPVVAAAGLDLEAVEVQPAGRRRLLRVVVDGDRGVDLDTVASLTRELSQTLDAADAMGEQPYVLEVTSPGVDRPLTQPRHWRRARGHLVTATLLDGTTVSGRVVDVDEEGGAARVQVAPAETLTVAFGQVRRAQVQVEFNRPPGVVGSGDHAPADRADGDHEGDDSGKRG